ncbi:hypothetical protein MXB_1159, partial [Myxobolus squamalis]
ASHEPAMLSFFNGHGKPIALPPPDSLKQIDSRDDHPQPQPLKFSDCFKTAAGQNVVISQTKFQAALQRIGHKPAFAIPTPSSTKPELPASSGSFKGARKKFVTPFKAPKYKPLALTPFWVLSFLKYRYDIEINKASRSIIKKITEKDHNSLDRMILRVSNLSPASIHHLAHEKVKNIYLNQIIELTDGFYGVLVSVDRELAKLIDTHAIRKYDKLVICNACVIEGGDFAGDPIEAYDRIILSISYNCTRKAHYYTKLGLVYPRYPITVSLASLKPLKIAGAILIQIIAKYDPETCEHFEQGSILYRSVQEEFEEASRRSILINEESVVVYKEISIDYPVPDSTSASQITHIKNEMNEKVLKTTEKIIQEKISSTKNTMVLEIPLNHPVIAEKFISRINYFEFINYKSVTQLPAHVNIIGIYFNNNVIPYSFFLAGQLGDFAAVKDPFDKIVYNL